MTALAPLTLDVRDILRSGGEPFGAIMQGIGALAPGQGLRLLTTFHPVPLLVVLAGRGFTHTELSLPNGEWEVLFTPTAVADVAQDIAKHASSSEFGDATAQSLDNRFLPPPEPMIRTLQALEGVPPGTALEALFDREPLILYGELRQRGHTFQADKRSDGSYRVLIRHSD